MYFVILVSDNEEYQNTYFVFYYDANFSKEKIEEFVIKNKNKHYKVSYF